MPGLQSTPAESPHHSNPLPELYRDPAQTLPEVYSPASGAFDRSHNGSGSQYGLQGAPVYEIATKEDDNGAATAPDDERKICGLRRRPFWMILAVITVLVIVAVIGGTVGGVLKGRNSGTDEQSAPNPSTSPFALPGDTNSTIGVNTTVQAPTPMRAVAASVAEKSVFVAWQNSDNDLIMNVYFDSARTWRQSIALTTEVAPIDSTPLTVLAWRWGEYFEVRVHYTSAQVSGLTGLRFRCYANTSSCDIPIQGGTDLSEAQNAPAAGAGIALVTTALNTLREYMVNAYGFVVEARYDPELLSWQQQSAISNDATAHLASPLAAVVVGDEVWAFWFSNEKRLQTAYCRTAGSTWSAVQNIDIAPIPAQLPRSLAVARSNTPDITQLFYLDGTDLQQVLYADGRWQAGNLVNSGVNTTETNGPLAAVGWDETALRTYTVVGGDLVEWASDPFKENARWVRGAMPASSYHA